MRLVSLVPSSTETLLALGADVVACTRFCEQPSLRHVGGTKNPDVEAIVELSPDVVVMDRQENRLEDARELERRGLRVHATDVCDVDGALRVVGELASLAEVPVPPAAVMPPEKTDRRRAFVPIWRRPWMSLGVGTYGESLLEHLGVELAVASADDPYPEILLDDVAALDVDVVLAPSEPYVFTDAHLDEIAVSVPGVPIVRVDGQDLFWWGIRTPGAAERLGASLLDRPAGW